MSKTENGKKDVDWLLRIVKIINLILIPIIIAVGGWFVTSHIQEANRENTKLLEQTKIRISQVETFTNYIPYLTSSKDEERLIALLAISILFNSDLAVKVGITDTTVFEKFVSQVGEEARKGLTDIKNKSIDKDMLRKTQKYLIKLNAELIFLKISNDSYSFVGYDTFTIGKVYANIKLYEELTSISIDWGESDESFQKEGDLKEYQIENDDYYSYSIRHQYQKSGKKKITVQVVTKSGERYSNEAQIYIQAL